MGAKTRLAIVLLPGILLFMVCGSVAGSQTDDPSKFFREYVGLNDDQIAAIRNGKAIAKVLNSTTPDQVFVFGAVYVKSTPEEYLKFASDVDALRKLPSYLAIRKFSDPPQLSDLEGFTLDADDIKKLQTCKPGQCEVQLTCDHRRAAEEHTWAQRSGRNSCIQFPARCPMRVRLTCTYKQLAAPMSLCKLLYKNWGTTSHGRSHRFESCSAHDFWRVHSADS